MPLYPISHNVVPPLRSPGQKSNPQTPRRINRTPGMPSPRTSPYSHAAQVLLSDGSPMKLKTPKKHMEDKAARRLQTSSTLGTATSTMGPPELHLSRPVTPTRPRPTGSGGKHMTPLFPPRLGLRKSPSSRGPAQIFNAPTRIKRARDPARPTVQLLQVMNKCWSDDTSAQVRWMLKDGLLNGRGEELDRSRVWDTLGHAVGNAWPHLRGWIMHHIPSEDNVEWFSGEDLIDIDDESCISDPDITTKHSSLERVGFFMSPKAYDTACELVRALSTRGTDFGQLMKSGINPFFMIYAFADSDILLPNCFSRELLWKHLDAILDAQCWRSLGSNRQSTTHGSSTSCHQNEDPEGIVGLLALVHGNFPLARKPDSTHVKTVHISINGSHWVATGDMGTIWSDAPDLEDADIPAFAVIDTLARVLLSCRGGILEIRTNNVRLLWGIWGAPLGAWAAVRTICCRHSVHLRAEWDELKGVNTRPYADPERVTVPAPGRDANVVNEVVEELRVLKGSGT